MGIEFKHERLASGIDVIAEIDHDAASSAVGVFVRTGARDEPAEVMGVSHFLEHMMFKGPEDLAAEALNAAMDDLGASNNAYTTAEMTSFYAHTLPEALPAATDLIVRMMSPALREDDFETERGVILEEIAMYDDNPFWVLLEAATERHYRGHPLGHRVLGTTDTVGSMSPAQMRDYFRRRYTAEASTVAFAGDVDFEAMVQRIEASTASWARGAPPPREAAAASGAGRFEMERDTVSRGYLLAVMPAPSLADERRYAARLMSQVLGAPGNSRLHWTLVEPGIADEATAAYFGQDGEGLLVAYASGDPERLEEIERVVTAELARAAAEATEDDLARLRSKAATGVTIGGERPADRMQRIGARWTVLGEYRTLQDELERVRGVSLADLRALSEAYPPTPATIGVLRPGRGAA
ncbi:MAG: pitrilysin family protein [Planctomycetota bacterium]